MLGLKRGTVELAKAHESWARLYEIEKELLQRTLGKLAVAIEHVGSTAIPDVPAKPIIDIRIAVSSLDSAHIEKFVVPLKKVGYEYKLALEGRHFFAKGPDKKISHHLSLVKFGSEKGWEDSILFRDFLRNSAQYREEYSTLKQKLAQQFAEDRKSYTKAKEEFIEKVVHLATEKL